MVNKEKPYYETTVIIEIKDQVMNKQVMHINCDLGEGMTDDALLMPFLDSCNIACGGHAGTDSSMLKTLELAKKFNVKAGAHPSFEDRLNFGRKAVQVPSKVLKSQLIDQITALNTIAKEEEVMLTHVKAHGALYNLSAASYELAMVLIEAITFFKEDLCIFVPYGSLIEDIVKKEGLSHKVEVFADRNYNDELKLMPRSHPQSVLKYRS